MTDWVAYLAPITYDFEKGNEVYITRMSMNVVYDKSKQSFRIVDIMSKPVFYQSTFGTGDGFLGKEHTYIVEVDGKNEIVEKVFPVPALKELSIEGIDVIKIETDFGKNVFEQGKGNFPEHPNRYKYTFADNTIKIISGFKI